MTPVTTPKTDQRLPRDAEPILYERILIDHCYGCPCIDCQYVDAESEDLDRAYERRYRKRCPGISDVR